VKKLKHFDGIAVGTDSHVLEKSADGTFDVNDAMDKNYNLVHLKKFGTGPSTCCVTLHVGFMGVDNDELGIPAQNR
jgi:hypothetical protein